MAEVCVDYSGFLHQRWVRRRNTRTKTGSIGTNIGSINHAIAPIDLVRGPKVGTMTTVINHEKNTRRGNGAEMRRELNSILRRSSIWHSRLLQMIMNSTPLLSNLLCPLTQSRS